MINGLYFPFAEYWQVYLIFTASILLLLLLDLGLFHRTPHAVGIKEATFWSVIWVSLGLLFSVGFYFYTESKFSSDVAATLTQQYITGFLIEKALAVDNIFVFIVIFGVLGIPPKYQHRILFFGILGALLFRSIAIALGSVLLSYHAVVIFFGVLLIATGIKTIIAKPAHAEPGKNKIITLLQRFLPVTHLHDQKFFVRSNGKLLVTPLFVALIAIEVSDIIFAVDSVPAIYAITNEPLIVFTSNVFAILGLRALYFVLATVTDKFHLLKYGLGLVLMFVGLKMVILSDLAGGKFPTSVSLLVVATFLGGSIIASLLFPPKVKHAAKLL